jgi:cyclophilin family peptidyl-prolyl cis-trans isomerase
MYPAREYEAVQSVFAALGKLKAKGAIPILERHTTDPQAAVRSAANDALEQLATMEKRMGRREMVPPPAEFFEKEGVDVRLAEPSKVTRITLHTTKGDVKINLFEQEARETVKNFARLAGRKYFDGLSFHRVVPGFVVQGGDPKGSGWGGPGHSILCEINPHRYERGVVGMALAGKDTGGSQFFITHAAHPHLDGTYTVFGKVTEGMPVVDALTVGDRIMRVELHRER